MLWTRADGQTLNKAPERDGAFFAAPEPWIDTWRTKAKVTLEAAREEVVEIDAIGRRRTLPVADGKVTVTLDGAARMYYGIDTGKLPTADAEH
jgi:hypothetical protein